MIRQRSITIFLPTLAAGGAERSMINYATEFAKSGFDVTLLVQRRKGELLNAVPATVKLVSLGRDRTLSCLLPLIFYLWDQRPDVFIANMGQGNIVSIWARALACVRTKLIVFQHNALSYECSQRKELSYKLLPLLYCLFLGWASRTVAVSNGVADDLSRTAGIPRRHIEVIYNPIITEDFESLANEPAGHLWFEDRLIPVILGVGRLVAQKDFANLIDAFAIVRQEKRARLVIIGHGPLREDLMRQSVAAGLSNHIAFLGHQANPLPFIKQAAVLAMSSCFEGFGNVIVEALGCGTPVVSTECPYGPSEILDGGRFGRLVPVGDKTTLANAILETLDNPGDPKLLKQRAQEFTAVRAAQALARIFGPAGNAPRK